MKYCVKIIFFALKAREKNLVKGNSGEFLEIALSAFPGILIKLKIPGLLFAASRLKKSHKRNFFEFLQILPALRSPKSFFIYLLKSMWGGGWGQGKWIFVYRLWPISWIKVQLVR
jgi:hypothetical protein